MVYYCFANILCNNSIQFEIMATMGYESSQDWEGMVIE